MLQERQKMLQERQKMLQERQKMLQERHKNTTSGYRSGTSVGVASPRWHRWNPLLEGRHAVRHRGTLSLLKSHLTVWFLRLVWLERQRRRGPGDPPHPHGRG